MLKKIEETIHYLTNRIKINPEIGIILGTGLGGLVREIEIEDSIDYDSIPHFPVSTVKGHQGKLHAGYLGGKEVIALQGRFHFYEGYTMEEVTFPVRIMKKLGIKLLIISNASGGVNSEYEVGDIMFINDHINFMPNPLIGMNYEVLGPRFTDMSEAYNRKIINEASRIAAQHGIRYHTGIYAGVTGPTFETPAEYNYIHTMGADAVGMSTVPEVIVARHMNLDCFAVSVITDLGVQGKIVEISHNDVIDAASMVEPKMTRVIVELLQKISI